MAVTIWALDYSATSVSDDDKWIFIHEMGHVWNWYHGGSNMRSAIWTWITEFDYEDAYKYDLADGSRLRSFNFEAQASIIADSWFVSQGHSPKYNTGSRKHLADYQPYIVQVQTSGPPAEPKQCKIRQPTRFQAALRGVAYSAASGRWAAAWRSISAWIAALAWPMKSSWWLVAYS